ncbi:MAG: ArsR family transcriptional regulator [Desulfurococcales archaeon]|nr:ArsR family transcriptional regulator [Desulfurococcales archaeon]
MDLEQLLRSRGRVRVLKVVLEKGQINISRLARETGLHHRIVSKYIEEFKSMGIVSEKRYGRLRVIEANLLDPRIGALRRLLRELEKL